MDIIAIGCPDVYLIAIASPLRKLNRFGQWQNFYHLIIRHTHTIVHSTFHGDAVILLESPLDSDGRLHLL